MKLRVARHTQNLQPLIDFYTDVVGLTILGHFEDHAGYDGVFIGDKNLGWHLEFTTSDEAPLHEADEDDMLVFYADSKQHYNLLIEKANRQKIQRAEPKNPYWKDNGTMLLDPDGFRVMIAISPQ